MHIDYTPAIAWAQTTLGVRIHSVHLLPARSSNRTYRLDTDTVPYILKYFAPERATSLTHERAILDYLAVAGFAVPAILAVADDLPDTAERVVLRSFTPGAPASARYDALTLAQRNGFLAAMGTMLARIHTLPLSEVMHVWQFPYDTVRTQRDWAENFICKKIASDLGVLLPAQVLPPAVAAAMAVRLPQWGASLIKTPVPLAPLHGDYYLDNVLISDDGTITGILDWEAARLGDPFWDIARMDAALFASDNSAAFVTIIGAYSHHVPAQWWLQDWLQWYRLLLAMGDLRYAVRHATALIEERVPPVVAFWERCIAEGDR